MAHPGPDVPLILMSDAALPLPPDLAGPARGARLAIASASRVRLTLASLALPEARMIWTDFGKSASVAARAAHVRAMGRPHRLVLADDGSNRAEVFAIMQAVITFLSILKRGRGRGIVLVVTNGPARVSLTQFLRRLRPSCDRCGINLALHLLPHAPVAGSASVRRLALH